MVEESASAYSNRSRYSTEQAFGSARRENLQVATTNELARIAAITQSRVDGDLGFNFLKHFVLKIDYQSSVLRLYRPFTALTANRRQHRDSSV